MNSLVTIRMRIKSRGHVCVCVCACACCTFNKESIVRLIVIVGLKQ